MMFYNCKKLKEVNIPHFRMYKVKNVSRMFANCDQLEKINIPFMLRPRDADLSGMLYDCKKLKEIDLSHINDEITSLSGFAFRCDSLVSLKLPERLAPNVDLASAIKLHRCGILNYSSPMYEEFYGMYAP